MASKLFGGTNLSDVARNVKERAEASPLQRPGAARPVLAAAEMALTGRTVAPLERENVFSVDPRRVRGWRFHNRTEGWYTKERCQDLIESIAKDGQQEPVVARKITGDLAFDYELIYGMRRRFACEHLNQKLRLRVVEADDARAAVLMHVENADRQDITPMERALSFQAQLDGRVFATQDALADAMGLSKGQVAKMVKAAALLRQGTISALFPDKSLVPVDQTYKLAALYERPGAKEVILKAAQNLAQKARAGEAPKALLKILTESLDRSKKFDPVQRVYNVGVAGKLVVTRNARGKVTLAFPKGVAGADGVEVMAAVGQVLKDLA
jgi:ParB family transcriptional regulator, chromosome partitioning protein